MANRPGDGMVPLDYGGMRASTADRERAVDVLKAAFAEGRLDQGEYADRVGLVYSSRTYAELASLTADPEDVTDAGVEDGAEVALQRTAVRSALAELPARDREVVALKFHGGLGNAELAQVLGISETAAGTLLYRAMEKLRRACDAKQ